MKKKLTGTDVLALDRDCLWHPYASLDATAPLYPVESASGCELFLYGGQSLVDGMSSWWSAIHGYNHPALNAALVEQSQKMSHVMFGSLTHEPAASLGAKLVALTPAHLTRVFLADSGSVSVEVAIKMALQYWLSRGCPQKHRLLSFQSGYHGDTFGAMSTSDPVTGMHHLFTEVLMKNIFAPAPPLGFNRSITDDDLAALETLFTQHHRNLAAVIIEPIVQGAGGMRFYSPDFLKHLKSLCQEFDVLLIADEIATGFGRTGKLFACEYSDISPDIMCLGKALTGGYMTLAATLCSDKVATGICQGDAGVLMHGPTFMANPLACAVANKSIELLLNSPWQTRIKHIEAILAQGLERCRDFAVVADVRTLGAIGVVELHTAVDMKKIIPEFIKQGIWLRPFGKLIYVMPPFTISDTQLNQIIDGIFTVLDNGHF